VVDHFSSACYHVAHLPPGQFGEFVAWFTAHHRQRLIIGSGWDDGGRWVRHVFSQRHCPR
jgi:hypothetical protein